MVEERKKEKNIFFSNSIHSTTNISVAVRTVHYPNWWRIETEHFFLPIEIVSVIASGAKEGEEFEKQEDCRCIKVKRLR